MQVNQVTALFNKIVRKMSQHFTALEEEEETKLLPAMSNKDHDLISRMQPTEQGLDDELEEVHKKSIEMLKEKQANLLASLVSPDFVIKGTYLQLHLN